LNLRHKLEAAQPAENVAAIASSSLANVDRGISESAKASSALEPISPVAAAAPLPPAPSAPLHFGALLWAALKDRLRRLFHRPWHE
jgi:hypothetical protein